MFRLQKRRDREVEGADACPKKLGEGGKGRQTCNLQKALISPALLIVISCSGAF